MFTGFELKGMRACQEAHMMHRCRIFPYLVESGSMGESVISYGEAVEAACGFEIGTRSGRGERGGHYEAIEADASLRLPLGVALGAKDKVEIIAAYGAELEPVLSYEVVKLPDNVGASGQLAMLKAVQV